MVKMNKNVSYFFENYVVHGYTIEDFRGITESEVYDQIMALNPDELVDIAEAVSKDVARFVNQ